MDIKNKIKEFWDNTPPQKKRMMSVGLIASVLVAVGYIGYSNRQSNNAATAKPPIEKKKDISLDTDLLGKTAYRQQEQDLRDRDEKMKELQKEIDSLKNNGVVSRESKYPSQPLPPFPSSSQSGSNVKNPLNPNYTGAPDNSREMAKPGYQQGALSETAVNNPPNSFPLPPGVQNRGVNAKAPADASLMMVGDIEILTNPNPVQATASDSGKKKAAEKIYLPPSYMEASLLSGLDAPTSENGKGNPVPVLIRVKNIAVLPNKVKMDLKSCFIIADGIGNLASERCELRLISLTCLAKNGSAVIDQKIKGFVVDGDGKIGLAGNVVAKMGQMLARSLLTGFFGGIGDGLKNASTITLTSATGSLQTINSGDLAKSAVGSGISQASHDLQKFYLDLGRQTLPVIEIGAARDITVVISEGIDLDIKNLACRSNILEGKCSEQL